MKVKVHPLILSLILTFSCSIDSNKSQSWDYSIFSEIQDIDILESVDSTIVIVKDDSWNWIEDYVTWRMNYLLWINKMSIDLSKPISLTVIHKEGKGIEQSAIYDTQAVKLIMDAFDYNPKFQEISKYFLTEFNPTEVMNIRDANDVINTKKIYEGTFTELFFDLSRCELFLCEAYERLEYISAMLVNVGMRDYFTLEWVKADDLLIKMNKIIEISGRDTIVIK